MNVESENKNYPPTEGSATVENTSDIEMVAVSDSSGAKNVRNVQTQHGDYRVDAENIFLIPRCLWPDDDDKKPATLQATTSKDSSAKAGGSGSGSCNDQQPTTKETEQVVWIEPFANQVC